MTASKPLSSILHSLTPTEIGEALKSRRTKLRLTLKQMSGRLGITESYLAQIEKGSRSPSWKIAMRIPEAYRISLDQLRPHNLVEDRVVVLRSGTPVEQLEFEEGLLYSWSSERVEDEHMFASLVTLAAGKKSGKTYHPVEEIIYVLEGSVLFRCNGQKEHLGPGDMVHFKSDHPHQVENLSTEDNAKMLLIRHPR